MIRGGEEETEGKGEKKGNEEGKEGRGERVEGRWRV